MRHLRLFYQIAISNSLILSLLISWSKLSHDKKSIWFCKTLTLNVPYFVCISSSLWNFIPENSSVFFGIRLLFSFVSKNRFVRLFTEVKTLHKYLSLRKLSFRFRIIMDQATFVFGFKSYGKYKKIMTFPKAIETYDFSI